MLNRDACKAGILKRIRMLLFVFVVDKLDDHLLLGITKYQSEIIVLKSSLISFLS